MFTAVWQKSHQEPCKAIEIDDDFNTAWKSDDILHVLFTF